MDLILEAIECLSIKYKFDKYEAREEIDHIITRKKISSYYQKNVLPCILKKIDSPFNAIIIIIENQINKECSNNIWRGSMLENISKLENNNSGIVGEEFISICCQKRNILSEINGSKTKKIGGGIGDGEIKEKSIEIKCSRIGINGNFQHELGENPWRSKFMGFVDITPTVIYLVIFKNFSENHYKECKKCIPYFSSRSICWRKKKGAFKIDTTKKINEEAIKNGYGIKIIETTTFREVGKFIDRTIK